MKPEELWHKMKVEYRSRRHVSLVAVDERQLIDELVEQSEISPEIVLAAWISYLRDIELHGQGTIGVKQFVRHINRYLAKAAEYAQPRKFRKCWPPGYNFYICENSFKLRFLEPKFCTGDGMDEERSFPDELPDCFEAPCPICNGRLWREGSDPYNRLKAIRDNDVEAAPDPGPLKKAIRKAVTSTIPVEQPIAAGDLADLDGDIDFF